ncbi:hypothetical protein TSAR_013699 [Trichomalopsis sarcophagae]|uniref:Uncharacterized protein n=1 Tax=Trichomalopsis sarcophagae TaxID=543379 RepID=A0A232EUV9_9HYME|nr:hypothetical protein TSAR_013699 [Trichomalopsis sarcophagae]
MSQAQKKSATAPVYFRRIPVNRSLLARAFIEAAHTQPTLANNNGAGDGSWNKSVGRTHGYKEHWAVCPAQSALGLGSGWSSPHSPTLAQPSPRVYKEHWAGGLAQSALGLGKLSRLWGSAVGGAPPTPPPSPSHHRGYIRSTGPVVWLSRPWGSAVGGAPHFRAPPSQHRGYIRSPRLALWLSRVRGSGLEGAPHSRTPSPPDSVCDFARYLKKFTTAGTGVLGKRTPIR